MSYECHVTTTVAHADAAEALAQEFGWKTSQIQRDPLLGDDTFFYLTKHNADFLTLYQQMTLLVLRMTSDGLPVLREKIEHIIYDTKKGA